MECSSFDITDIYTSCIHVLRGQVETTEIAEEYAPFLPQLQLLNLAATLPPHNTCIMGSIYIPCKYVAKSN